MKRAILIGATGLVGSHILELLLNDARFNEVVVLGRRSTGKVHSKLKEQIVDFEAPHTWADDVKGDVVFSALGTTARQARSQAAQYRVDYSYQYGVAQAAARHAVETFVLISSTGANPRSPFFYLRMKGELERDVAKLAFARTRILQPGALVGERSTKRTGEELTMVALKGLSALPGLKRLAPIQGKDVARVALACAFEESPGIKHYPPLALFSLAS